MRMVILAVALIVVGSLVMVLSRLPPVSSVPTVAGVSQAQASCPTGFIRVPGSALYHTPDFCVMKYDAKCANRVTPTLGLEPAKGSRCTDGQGVYKNNGSGCSCTGDREVVSLASGYPITYIPEDDGSKNTAKAYCEAAGWHLITNNEWMTIARNVEQVNANWCKPDGTGCGNTPGTPGTVLANGHFDSSAKALVASEDSFPCFGTTTDGSNICGAPSSQKRTLTLNNGQVIWDFAGNVWQWVDLVVMRKDEPKSQSHGKSDVGWLKSDFAPGSLPSVITDNGQGSGLGYDAVRPSNPTWNANNGVGRIYHYATPGDTSTALYSVIRGGNWRHGTDDGAFTMHLSPPPNHLADDVGFRCVVNYERL